VIMAGGQGERFWPLTHKNYPKYLIRLNGEKSLLQKTYERLSKVYKKQPIYVVTTQDHVQFVSRELPMLRKAQVLVEPFRNNTAPALFFSAAVLAEKYGLREVISFFPADHLIERQDLFHETVTRALRAAEVGKLTTIGIQPKFPATGYGYIETGRRLPVGRAVYEALRFKEKPRKAAALAYLRRKNFLWNSGIFAWRADVFFEKMKRFCPEIHNRFDLRHLKASYRKLPRISIDYALMEKVDQVAVVKTRMDWCDMGNWDMFFDKAKKDRKGNYVEGFVTGRGNRDSLLINHTEQPLAAAGLQGFIAVKTRQGALLAERSGAEEAALLMKKG